MQNIVPLNRLLYNLPIDSVKPYTIGNWSLVYTRDLIDSSKENPPYNPYMILDYEQIIFGNDNGKILTSEVLWRNMYWQGDSLALITYNMPFRPTSYPVYKNIIQIKNDTLIIEDKYNLTHLRYFYIRKRE